LREGGGVNEAKTVPGWEKAVPFGEVDGKSERDRSGFADGMPEGIKSGTQLSGAGGSGWPEHLAALQATGFMARCDKPTERAHALGSKIAVVGLHPKRLPQRRRQVGKPASDAAKKGMRKGCHRQTSGLSDRCLSGHNAILVRGAQGKYAECPSPLGLSPFRTPATVRMTGPGPWFCARLLASLGNEAWTATRE